MEITDTPWGRPDHVVKLAEGIHHVETPSHGGIVLSAERVALMPESIEPFTRDRRYWEEDCDWAVPCLMFAEEWDGLKDYILDAAIKSLREDDLETIKIVRIGRGLTPLPVFIGP